MSEQIKLTLLYGGKSGEHEVSLCSAASVLSNLDRKRYHITPVGIDKTGQCFINDTDELLKYGSQIPVKGEHSKPLPSLFVNGKFALNADIVFPVIHGPLYEDGALQGLLELANIAYVGSPVLGSAIGMDKDIARQLVKYIPNIFMAEYYRLTRDIQGADLQEFCKKIIAELGLPLFVKPCAMGSSVGIHKVTEEHKLISAIEDARQYDHTILIEAFVPGREIELAVLENRHSVENPKVSLPGEIRVFHPDGFYSYSAKYLESEQSELIVAPPMAANLQEQFQKAAANIFVQLRCRGMARVDFFLSGDKIYFSEINTLPGFTTISMYPKLWQASGLAYTALLDELILLGMEEFERKTRLKTNY